MAISRFASNPEMASFGILLVAVCSFMVASDSRAMAFDSGLRIFGAERERPAPPLNDSAASALIFQTSVSITVPCSTTIIRPPAGHAPPVRTVIAVPTQNGTYPVILFKHGFNLANCFYTQLFAHLASSGYIVVAPQALSLSTDTTQEIMETAEVANWIPKSLALVLTAAQPTVDAVPDMAKLVVGGHSRGGKIAFALALGKVSDTELPSFSALLTLDPVDGTELNSESIPQMVQAGCDHTLNTLSIPVLILGAGYGNKCSGLFCVMPPCAPACCSHEGYFNCSSSPTTYHFTVLEYGHLDFLDDSQSWSSIMCMSGTSKAPLRNFAGRLSVSFLQATLEGNTENMEYLLQNWKEISPKLDEPQTYIGESAHLLKGFSKNA